jgi:hypothetical protein
VSKGPGIIEKRIADIFAATRDRALSIDDIARHAFKLQAAPTRAQRLSATRAAHRLLRRVREAYARHREIVNQAHADTEATLGRKRRPYDRKAMEFDDEYEKRLESHPLWAEHERLWEFANRIGCWGRHMRGDRPGYIRIEEDFWQAITLKGRLYFHPPDAPLQVWAVSIQPAGVIWADAEVTKVTARNVMVHYAGKLARLDRRRLWYWWAFWRGCRFVSSRTGRIAGKLDELWQRRYGHASGGVPPVLQMPLARAMELLGLAADYTREDVIAAFRRAVKKAHPDVGGTAEMFRIFVEARDRLLAALGTSAPAPKEPHYAPKGMRVVYRSGRRSSSHQQRLGSTRGRLA